MAVVVVITLVSPYLLENTVSKIRILAEAKSMCFKRSYIHVSAKVVFARG